MNEKLHHYCLCVCVREREIEGGWDGRATQGVCEFKCSYRYLSLFDVSQLIAEAALVHPLLLHY